MKKEARSALTTRAIEGLIGATLGGGLGAAGGAMYYEPKNPAEWTDQTGDIRGRPYTPEENKERWKLIRKAALLGAAGGGAVSLGASAYLGHRTAAAEREAVKGLKEDFTEPLKDLLDDYKVRKAALLKKGGPKDGKMVKRLDRQISEAKKLQKRTGSDVENLLDEAKNRRSQVLYHGAFHPEGKGESGYDWSKMTHKGVLKEHFDRLAERRGYEKFNLKTAKKIYDDMVRSRMTKTSAEAFHRELYSIHEGF